jgi:7-carboxy-7-deazaguanine synthase
MPELRLPVVEIFGPTLQGEGIFSGMRAAFVRFAGCDTHCSWCDTKYSWSLDGVDQMTPREILKRVQDASARLVVLTGGNPCIHDLGELVDLLKQDNRTVHVETQGTVLPYWLAMVDLITICPKISSGEDFPRVSAAISSAMTRSRVQLKFVVFTDQDYQDARSLARTFPDLDFVIQPGYDCDGHAYTFGFGALAERVARDVLLPERVRFMPQLHRLIWGDRRGV